MSRPGYLTDAELTTVQGNLQLANRAAQSFLAMRDDAAEQDHVNVEIVPPGGAYRSMALTLAMRANPAKYNVTPGIVPSLYSIHLEGDAADIGSGFAWVKKNGHKFGWSFPLKSDPNHSVYDGVTVPAGGGTPIEEEEEVRHMYRAALRDTTKVAYFDSISFAETVQDSVDDNAWGRFVGKPGLTVSQEEWDSYKRVAAVNAAKCGGSGGNNGPVLEAVAGVAGQVTSLGEKVSAFPKPPTRFVAE